MEFSALYGTLKLMAVFTMNVTGPCQEADELSPYCHTLFFNGHFNIILTPVTGGQKFLSSLQFFRVKMCMHLSHAGYIISPFFLLL